MAVHSAKGMYVIVNRVFIGCRCILADVHADDSRFASFSQVIDERINADIIKSHAIDYGATTGDTEQPFSWIASLWSGRHGPKLQRPEAKIH